jgi:SAM-dependent methyltransferase
MLTPPISDNSVTNRSYWDSVWSAAGASLLDPNDFYAGRNGLFVKLVRRHIGDIRDRSLVELGGGGNNTRLLAVAKWLGADVTVLDFSDEGLRAVGELFAANACRVRLVNVDLDSWVPEDAFDIVTHWGVLEHFVDPRPLLEKSVAALNPGGTLIFSMPNMEAFASRLWKRWNPDNWGVHVWHCEETVLRCLADLGLSDVLSFHFGVPFVKMGPWETRTAAQYPFDLLQLVASASARVLPVYHRWGHRKLSMERGFVARRRA